MALQVVTLSDVMACVRRSLYTFSGPSEEVPHLVELNTPVPLVVPLTTLLIPVMSVTGTLGMPGAGTQSLLSSLSPRLEQPGSAGSSISPSPSSSMRLPHCGQLGPAMPLVPQSSVSSPASNDVQP